jgi:hypothetical protein
MQDAVTMLMRGLGYRDLPYPHGFLARAIDGRVRLLGAPAQFAVDSEFRPLENLTRDGMAMLLYNYLHSAYRRIEMTWTGAGGVWEANEFFQSVFNVFGIEERIGYVTGIPGYRIELWVDTGVSSATDAGDAIARRQIPAAMADLTNRRNPFDLYIGWLNPAHNDAVFHAINNPLGAGNPRHERNREVLGFEDYELEDLLGLKVVVYDDLRPAAGRQLPRAQVLGTKSEIKIDDAKVTFGDDSWADGWRIRAWNEEGWRPGGIVSFEIEDREYFVRNQNFNNQDFRANTNLYVYDRENAGSDRSTNILRASTEAFNIWNRVQDDNIREFASFVDRSKHYILTRIDNGFNEGRPDYLYIFEPFRVGVRIADHDGVRLVRTVVADGDQDRDTPAHAPAPVNAAVPAADWATFWAVGEAYFYTARDLYYIQGKLNKSEELVVNRITGNNNIGLAATTTTLAQSLTLNFANTRVKALGAMENRGGVQVGNRVILYTEEGNANPLLIRNVSPVDRSPRYTSNYGVVISHNASLSHVPGVGIVDVVTIFDAATGQNRTLYVPPANVAIGGDTFNGGPGTLNAGDYVAIFPHDNATMNILVNQSNDNPGIGTRRFTAGDEYLAGVAMGLGGGHIAFGGAARTNTMIPNPATPVLNFNNYQTADAGHEASGAWLTASTEFLNAAAGGADDQRSFQDAAAGRFAINASTILVVGNPAQGYRVFPATATSLHGILGRSASVGGIDFAAGSEIRNIVAVGRYPSRWTEDTHRPFSVPAASHVFITTNRDVTGVQGAATGEFGVIVGWEANIAANNVGNVWRAAVINSAGVVSERLVRTGGAMIERGSVVRITTSSVSAYDVAYFNVVAIRHDDTTNENNAAVGGVADAPNIGLARLVSEGNDPGKNFSSDNLNAVVGVADGNLDLTSDPTNAVEGLAVVAGLLDNWSWATRTMTILADDGDVRYDFQIPNTRTVIVSGNNVWVGDIFEGGGTANWEDTQVGWGRVNLNRRTQGQEGPASVVLLIDTGAGNRILGTIVVLH